MSQADIDAFVDSAYREALMPEGVKARAVVARGIPVNGRDSYGITALHRAVVAERCDVVVALLAAGADPNVKDYNGTTSVWWAAFNSTADIVQLLIDGGGCVNEADKYSETPLIALVDNIGDAAARLQVLLAYPELDLDAKFQSRTAEEWAAKLGYMELAVAIAEERARRQRWSALRAAWVAATTAPTSSAYCFLSPMDD
jgi:ankyrin repeat protein